MHARHRRATWLAAVLIAATVGVAYHNSLSGPFIFDDLDSIVGNPRIRALWPPSEALGGTSRPLVALTLAANYAAGGLAVRGYHALNLVIHLLAALALFAILRRTLAGPRLGARFAGAADGIAFAAAALWAAHPLATQAVTYVIQRAESLAGLLYLATLYATIRGAASARRAVWWYALAAVACVLGAATKPTIASAPLVVLLYDRFFLAGSFREALTRRGPLYLALAASWAVVAALAIAAPDTAAGFHLRRVTPLAYAATQPGVVLHYLRLAFWPHPLVLDYGWPLAQTFAEVAVPGLALAAIAGVTLWQAARLRPIGFAGAWFFLALAPTSSVFPIHDPAFEHRMYLALAAPVVLVVLAGHELLARRARLPLAAAALAVLGVAAACVATIRRNHDYRSEIAIWSDVVAKRPQNARGHMNLGRALLRGRDAAAAMPHLVNAVRLAPGYPEAHNNLGAAYAEQGRLDEAMVEFGSALALKPDLNDARYNLGRGLLQQSRFDQAIAELEILLRAQPSNAKAWQDLGSALTGARRLEEALAAYGQALRLAPRSPEVHNNLGVALMRLGRRDEAVSHFREALSLQPDFAAARQNLERALPR
jgi:Flp pilus assembly protein TadD